MTWHQSERLKQIAAACFLIPVLLWVAYGLLQGLLLAL